MRNKKELWRAQAQLSSTRKQARSLLAATDEVRRREEKKFLDSLVRKGLVREGSPLDGVLNLTVEDVLERRLQSMIFKKGMAATPQQARQAIVHGHVVVGERRVTVPSYPVTRGEESAVKLLGGHRTTVKGEAAPAQVK